MAIDPYYSKAYFNRGVAKSILKMYKESITDFTKVIQLDPTDTEAYNSRGRARFESNDKKGGCLDWSKAGELGDFNAYEVIQEKCNN